MPIVVQKATKELALSNSDMVTSSLFQEYFLFGLGDVQHIAWPHVAASLICSPMLL